jgi:hypothetical protein
MSEIDLDERKIVIKRAKITFSIIGTVLIILGALIYYVK